MKKIKESADRKTVSSKSSVRRHSTAPESTTFPVEQEVQAGHDRYLMRVRPYKTWDNKIEGAVVTFMNMDAIRLTIEETLE